MTTYVLLKVELYLFAYDAFFCLYKQIKLSSDLPYELLYGRAGYLWAASFLNNHIGTGTISNTYTVSNFFSPKFFLIGLNEIFIILAIKYV